MVRPIFGPLPPPHLLMQISRDNTRLIQNRSQGSGLAIFIPSTTAQQDSEMHSVSAKTVATQRK